MSDIAQKTIAIIADFKEIDVEGITVESKLEEDLEMDSLDALNLVFDIEEEFDIEIPDDKAFEMKTVGDMVEGIEKLIELKAAGIDPKDAMKEEAPEDNSKGEAGE